MQQKQKIEEDNETNEQIGSIAFYISLLAEMQSDRSFYSHFVEWLGRKDCDLTAYWGCPIRSKTLKSEDDLFQLVVELDVDFEEFTGQSPSEAARMCIEHFGLDSPLLAA